MTRLRQLTTEFGQPALRATVLICLLAAVQACSAGPPTAEQATDSASADAGYCQVIRDYAEPADCTEFERQASRQKDGTAAFNAPNPLKRGQSFSVTLAVAANRPKPPVHGSEPRSADDDPPGPEPVPAPDASESSETPPAEADAAMAYAPEPSAVIAPMPGHPETFSVTVGDHVAADLTGGEAFKIVPRQDRVQDVELDAPYHPTLWVWDVTALKGGEHVMTITTTVLAKDRRGSYHNLNGSPNARTFNVQVDWSGRIRDWLEGAPDWIKLVGGVFGALAVALGFVKDFRDKLLSLLGLRKEPPAPPPPPKP